MSDLVNRVYKVICNNTLVDALSHIYKGDIINPLVNRFTRVIMISICTPSKLLFYKGANVFTRGFMLITL